MARVYISCPKSAYLQQFLELKMFVPDVKVFNEAMTI